jgi:hypothetical protein
VFFDKIIVDSTRVSSLYRDPVVIDCNGQRRAEPLTIEKVFEIGTAEKVEDAIALRPN